MEKIKVKLKLHQFDALSVAVINYVPGFILSNNRDVAGRSEREFLSRHVMICIAEEIKESMAAKLLSRSNKITLLFSRAQAIVLYYLLQNIPIGSNDHFAHVVICDVIATLQHYILKQISE